MTAQNACARHSWLVSRSFVTILGQPMEVLRCRFCGKYKNRRIKVKKS